MYSIHYSCQIFVELECSQQISKNHQISNLMKIRRLGAELLHADRQTYGLTEEQTGRSKPIVTSQFWQCA